MLKTFNTTYATTLLAGVVVGQPQDVFIAHDEADAKSKVAELVKSRARWIDGKQFLHIVEQSGLSASWASTIEILS